MSYEHPFEINDYGVPAVYEKNMALARQLLQLLYLIPGTYPTAPEMGIGLSLYKFEDLDAKLFNEIKDVTEKQIERYLPVLIGSEIEFDTVANVLIVGISINGQIFTFNSEENTGKVSLNSIY